MTSDLQQRRVQARIAATQMEPMLQRVRLEHARSAQLQTEVAAQGSQNAPDLGRSAFTLMASGKPDV